MSLENGTCSANSKNLRAERILAWKLELFTAFLVVTAFAVLISVLLSFSGRPQTAWSLHWLSLNGFVALLATLLQSALLALASEGISQGKYDWFWGKRKRQRYEGQPLRDLQIFDDASRGPLGSIKLLWRLKAWHLPSLGAALMLMILALPTFTQQILSVEYRLVPSPYNASLPSILRAEIYNGSRSYDGIEYADFHFTASIYDGILLQNDSELPVACPTGTCSWPITPSLGVCGACLDITEHLRVAKIKNSSDCSVYINKPDDVFLRVKCQKSTGLGSADNQLMIVSQSDFGYVLNSSLVDEPKPKWQNQIIEFTIIGVQNYSYMELYRNDATASNCLLWYCLQAHKNGITASGPMLPGYLSTGPGGFEPVIFTDIPNQFNAFAKESGTNYSVDDQTMQNSFVETHLILGSVTVLDPPQNWSDIAKTIYAALADPGSWIKRLALSMSNNVRSTGRASQTDRYNGTSYMSAPFIKVIWVWISYPVAMLIISLVFLFTSILQPYYKQAPPPWKHDALALLLLHVRDHGKALRLHKESGDAINDEMEDRRAMLTQEEGQWIFRLSNPSTGQGSP
ncbi:hypothetical protein EV356DRAFT_529569 [Viridothelium virens]|uniref:Uncharacterized protein n=1 Tax=Viridothelium virens TaxID=1048519 RepID=A0A6A6HJT7_VIRVR|nr:hypothetical protein EV356DRAFT_529569 [Viridothelium virens]